MVVGVRGAISTRVVMHALKEIACSTREPLTWSKGWRVSGERYERVSLFLLVDKGLV